MYYEKIEELSQEQIQELYNDVINSDGDFQISGTGLIYWADCDNGRRGYYPAPKYGHEEGWSAYYRGGIVTNAICGTDNSGRVYAFAEYNTASGNGLTHGTLFYIECQNGISGFWLGDRGYVASPGYVKRNYPSGYARDSVCGRGVLGTATAYSNY